jgi:hypothetical protein
MVVAVVGKPEGKRSQGKPRSKWEGLREIGWAGVEWINLAQDRGAL